jgi:hypothetical protein
MVNSPVTLKPTNKKPVPKSGFSDCCICTYRPLCASVGACIDGC